MSKGEVSNLSEKDDGEYRGLVQDIGQLKLSDATSVNRTSAALTLSLKAKPHFSPDMFIAGVCKYVSLRFR